MVSHGNATQHISMLTFIEYQQSQPIHLNKRMSQSIEKDPMRRYHNPHIQQHSIPNTLLRPVVDIVLPTE